MLSIIHIWSRLLLLNIVMNYDDDRCQEKQLNRYKTAMYRPIYVVALCSLSVSRLSQSVAGRAVKSRQ